MQKFLSALGVLVVGIALGLYLSGNPVLFYVVAMHGSLNSKQIVQAFNQSLESTNSKSMVQTVKQTFSTPVPEKGSASQGLWPGFFCLNHEAEKSFEAWDDDDMSAAGIAYYVNVLNRVMKRT